MTNLFEWAAEQAKSTPEQAADEAIARVGANADPGWLRKAQEAIYLLMDEGPFTTDDVWAVLNDWYVKPPREPRAMGAAMRIAQQEGWIVATGNYRKSERVECHGRPVMIWEAK
jgi:hypothetical protein